MTILVSPNESEVKKALGDDGFEAPLPFDFLLYTSRGPIPAERKRFPDDFIASVKDGRWAREAAAMRQYSPYCIGIIEGEGRYTSDDKLRIGNRVSQWSRAGVRNMFRSLRYVEGVDLEFTSDILDTVECLKEMQAYFDKDTHISLRTRPRFESDWFTPVYEERFIYWLQGCGAGISIVRARAFAKVFKNPGEVFNASVEDFMSIPGIGPTMAKNVYNFLRGIT